MYTECKYKTITVLFSVQTIHMYSLWREAEPLFGGLYIPYLLRSPLLTWISCHHRIYIVTKKIYRLMYQQIMKHSENVLPSQDSCSLFALS